MVTLPDRRKAAWHMMEFGIYLHQLAEHLGEAQLPVNGRWQRAAEIVRADAVHYPLVKRIVADLYKRGRCSKPTDPITIDAILDYLGQLQYELKAEPGNALSGNDLEAIRLVERIGEISVSLFGIDTAPGASSSPRGPGIRRLRQPQR